ncbi:MAG: AMP-binding protein [Ignavibacteria bacterium]|jgi:long-chain acyl-CoA synthetase|nr:AMP-binding protein [Ignavibacteria bacterium]
MKREGFNSLYEKSFKENWELQALTDYDGTTLCYKDVVASIAKLHILFNECKLHRGDKVAICGRNQSNWGVVFLAALTYGAVAVPILHEFKPDNIHHIVNHSDAQLLFVSKSIWENLNEDAMPEINATIALADFSIQHSKNPQLYKLNNTLNDIFNKKYSNGISQKDIHFYKDKPNDLALISYTSGTSGNSKGVMLPFRSIKANVQFAEFILPLFTRGGRLVSMLPMAHMYGLCFEFLFGMCVGAHMHFLTRLPTPKIIMEAFSRIKPTLIISVPLIIEKIYKKQLLPVLEKTSIKMLLKLPLIDKVLLMKIKNTLDKVFGGEFIEIVVGGAAFSKDAEQFFKRIGFRYTVGYGMTECGPLISYEQWDRTALYSCGKPLPNLKVMIDSTDPMNISGEILVKGDNVFLGYYKNKEASKDCFTKDGWFRTGDMGTLDDKGNLYIRGRCKTMILGPSGQNIYPEEIEDLLNSYPYVLESLVIEQQDGKLAALIYPDYEAALADNINENDIPKLLDESLKHINNELPHYSQIAYTKIVFDEFEKTPKRSIKRYLYQVPKE